MYRLIKQLFPDDMVLREASPSWLGRQRLDVFLPDRGLAIEYQGAQHYAPVELFGGAEALQRTMERDTTKKRLCDENQVELILHHRVQTTGFQPVSFSFTMGVEGVADEGGYWGGILGEGLFAAAGR